MSSWTKLFCAWVVALAATAGSLFFSEVLGYPPCALCWYQRIAIYPLVLILGLALFPQDLRAVKFALPLALAGWGVAIYHNLLYYHWIPDSLAPCRQGVSCTTVQWVGLGFLTIPLLSLVAFTLLLVILGFTLKDMRHEN